MELNLMQLSCFQAKSCTRLSAINMLGIIVLLSVLFPNIIEAQNSIKGGTSLIVSSGTSLVSSQNLLLENTSGLTVNGTLILKQDLINQNTASDFGSGTVEFSGLVAQNISGQNTFGTLKVANAAGIDLSGNTTVNTLLNLEQGHIRLGAHNLTLGTLATISGTPSASNMVVATGSGELRKSFAGAGSFTFPVGDITGTAQYTPVALTFTGGTFGTGNYAGAKLSNNAYAGSAGNYLNRYWVLTQNGITIPVYNATFQYYTADVTGVESEMSCNQVDPTPAITYNAANTSLHQLSATGVTSFGTFTGSPAFGNLNLKVYLEGPYAGSGTMNTTLNPTQLPLGQPYNTLPWSYAGTESVSSIPSGVVDWILVELRQAGTPEAALPETKLAGWPKAFFLKNDGTVVSLTGSSTLDFGNPAVSSNLYAVIRHRNHLAIMGANPLALSGNTYNYDFSTAVTQAFGGTTGYKQLGTGVYGMVSGDTDVDGNISVLDFSRWATFFGYTSSYLQSDIDMDSQVSVLDFSDWATNFGVTNPVSGVAVPKFASQIPVSK